MPLFDIPGWSVAIPSVSENPTPSSSKRKRSLDGSRQLSSEESNLDNLVKTLGGSHARDVRRGHQKKRKLASLLGGSDKVGREKDPRARDAETHKPLSISRPRPLRAANKQGAKRLRAESISDTTKSQTTSSRTASVSLRPQQHVQGLTRLQEGMRQSLDGARFRLINERLYKTNSREAHKMVKDEPRVFEDYHIGFRHQVESWPTNPVNHYLSALSAYPPKTVIADLGCGDATLARALIPKGKTVLSFDLVSDGTFVIEADICERIPLPGSESTEDVKSSGEGHIVDVVVCSLSLMGTNWPNCVREAWRILKARGELQIAEVASRFVNVDEFENLINMIGFQLKSKDDSNSHFTLFEFEKVPRKKKSEKEWRNLLAKADLLKPCEYKRR